MTKHIELLALSTALVLAAVVAASAAASGKPGYTCSRGFTAVTPDGAVGLPRTQAAIADGLISASDALLAYDAIDANGTGVICVKLPHGWEVGGGPFSKYYYEFSDDIASVPGG